MQISLPPETYRLARRRAAERRTSFAEYIRQLLRRDLDEADGAKVDSSALFGLGDSGGSATARHKDEYIGDDRDAAHPRR